MRLASNPRKDCRRRNNNFAPGDGKTRVSPSGLQAGKNPPGAFNKTKAKQMKFKIQIKRPDGTTLHGTLGAKDAATAKTYLNLPKGFKLALCEEVAATHACFYDADFDKMTIAPTSTTVVFRPDRRVDGAASLSNEQRADNGLVCLENVIDFHESDKETAVSDLLANLRHLCDREEIDFDHCLDMANRNWSAER
jgi:hypothetical protein